MDLKRLADEFPPDAIEWRVQSCGDGRNDKPWARVLCYINNRAIQDRLDEVCGMENWQNVYAPGPAGGVICGISIRIDDEWITKWDGADNTDIEAVKGGLSNAMKRAGAMWTIGRYLYKLEEAWAETTTNMQDKWNYPYTGKTKQNTKFRWRPPAMSGERPMTEMMSGDDQERALTLKGELGLTDSYWAQRLKEFFSADNLSDLTAEQGRSLLKRLAKTRAEQNKTSTRTDQLDMDLDQEVPDGLPFE